MRLGLLAYIHESVDFLPWAIQVLQRSQVDRFIVLGDVTETGKRLRETIEMLSAVDAVGVWGNHDIGFCLDPELDLLRGYDPAVTQYIGSLRPRVEVEDCLFTHIEPWLERSLHVVSVPPKNHRPAAS